MRPRMYGSSDSQIVRERYSPSFGSGIGWSTTSKLAWVGSPCGRDFSSTRRLVAMASSVCLRQAITPMKARETLRLVLALLLLLWSGAVIAQTLSANERALIEATQRNDVESAR